MATGQRTDYSGPSRTSPDRQLPRLTRDTGGNFVLLKQEQEWEPTFVEIVQELRRQYVIGIIPAAPAAKVQNVEVKLKQPGLSVRARRSITAPSHEGGE